MAESITKRIDWENQLKLLPHPEGGAYREIYRSIPSVELIDGRRRQTLTHIYFLLKSGQVSLFHRVDQDEIWHLYDGQGLKLMVFDVMQQKVDEVLVGREYGRFCAVVPAGVWQAATCLGEYALCGCSVAPGFEFEDLELLSADTPLGQDLIAAGYGQFIKQEAD